MKLEPESLFIGVIDFFSVLLPGAVLTYLVKDDVEANLLGSVFPRIAGEAAGWAAFLFSSYLLGHFIFLIGSYLDKISDPIRKPAAAALKHVRSIKDGRIPEVESEVVVNAFQWAKARLTIQCPDALVEVQRLEADSKFFRSLVVVLLFAAAWVIVRAGWRYPVGFVALFCLALCGLSFWRYVERRSKAIKQAYWFVITLEHWPPSREEKGKP